MNAKAAHASAASGMLNEEEHVADASTEHGDDDDIDELESEERPPAVAAARVARTSSQATTGDDAADSVEKKTRKWVQLGTPTAHGLPTLVCRKGLEGPNAVFVSTITSLSERLEEIVAQGLAGGGGDASDLKAVNDRIDALAVEVRNASRAAPGPSVGAATASELLTTSNEHAEYLGRLAGLIKRLSEANTARERELADLKGVVDALKVQMSIRSALTPLPPLPGDAVPAPFSTTHPIPLGLLP